MVIRHPAVSIYPTRYQRPPVFLGNRHFLRNPSDPVGRMRLHVVRFFQRSWHQEFPRRAGSREASMHNRRNTATWSLNSSSSFPLFWARSSAFFMSRTASVRSWFTPAAHFFWRAGLPTGNRPNARAISRACSKALSRPGRGMMRMGKLVRRAAVFWRSSLPRCRPRGFFACIAFPSFVMRSPNRPFFLLSPRPP